MAKLIKCPRCQSQIDVTNVAGGGTVRCPDCGAMVRIPTGSTGQYQKVQAAVPQAAAPQRETKSRPAGSGRGTNLFKKMSGARTPGGAKPPSRASIEAEERRGGTSIRRKGGNTGLIAIGCGIGAVVLIVVLGLAMSSKGKRTEEAKLAKEEKRVKVDKLNKERAEEQRRLNEEAANEQAAAKAAAAGGKPASMTRKEGGKYDVSATFEPGARKQVKIGSEFAVDAALNREYENLASAGRVGDLLKEEAKWLPCIITGLLSESEPIARTSLQALSDYCKSKNITTEKGNNPVSMEYANSSYYRGGEYNFWADWWATNKNRVAGGGGGGGNSGPTEPRVAAEDPAKANWQQLMQDLRAGGAFDKFDRPEGRAFARVQSMGKGAYPYLIKYIDDEELPLSKAAVTVLNALTSRQGTIPNANNKAQIKSEWEAWYSKEGK